MGIYTKYKKLKENKYLYMFKVVFKFLKVIVIKSILLHFIQFFTLPSSFKKIENPKKTTTFSKMVREKPLKDINIYHFIAGLSPVFQQFSTKQQFH